VRWKSGGRSEQEHIGQQEGMWEGLGFVDVAAPFFCTFTHVKLGQFPQQIVLTECPNYMFIYPI